MKFTSYSFTLIAATTITVALLGAASVSNVSAFVPAHLEYLTDAELEQAASASTYNTDRLLLVNPAVGKGIGFTESDDESDDETDDESDDESESDDFSNTDDEEENNDDSSDDDASSELSSETEDIFDAASGGATTSETKATFLDFSNKPIVFSQFSSDTCDPSTELYSSEIISIKLIKFGEFCISDTIDLGNDGETIISYTKLTNEDCSLFGVVDTYNDCTDEDCSECNDNDNYKSITTWDQIFPDPFAEHCFQTSYASDGESFDNPLNVDYQFALDSTENGLAYKKFIVINSCVQDFVSSEDVTFTTDSVTVTDEDGSSATITEDSLLLEDGDGASIEIDTEDGSITFEDESGNTLEVDDADVTITEDGSLVVVNDDILIVANDEGDFLAITENSLTIGDDNAYITVTENAITFGDSKEPSNYFTLEDVDVVVGDDLEFITISFMDPDGSITFYDESVVFSNADGDFTVSDTEYSFTDGVFTIYGNTEEGELFGLGFNDEGAIFGIEDTFLAGFDSTTMTGFFINDDQAVFGEIDDLVSDDDANDDDDASDDDDLPTEEDDDADDDGASDDDADLVSDDDYLVNIISASFGGGDDDGACLSISELLCSSEEAAGKFSAVCEFLTDNNIEQLFEGQSLTIFAPIDSAFDSLDNLLEKTNTELDDDTIGEIFSFHVTLGMVTSDDLECSGLTEMIGGGSSRTKCGREDGIEYLIQKGGGNRENNIEPIIIAADIIACNDSVIHVVNEVLLPNFIGALM